MSTAEILESEDLLLSADLFRSCSLDTSISPSSRPPLLFSHPPAPETSCGELLSLRGLVEPSVTRGCLAVAWVRRMCLAKESSGVEREGRGEREDWLDCIRSMSRLSGTCAPEPLGGEEGEWGEGEEGEGALREAEWGEKEHGEGEGGGWGE